MNNTDAGNSYKSLVKGRAGVDHKTAGPETKEFPASLHIKSVDLKNRRITALASTGRIDRYEEIILPEAFRESLPIYMSNSVVLAAHQHKLETGQSPVVANIIKADITTEGLLVIIEFHNITGLAEEYWQLYSQKKQRGISVGFRAQEGRYEDYDGRRVYVHTKIELLEVSLVPIPANPEALSRSKQRKIAWLDEKKRPDDLDEIERELLEIVPDADIEYERKNAEELARLWLGDESETTDNGTGEKTDLDCAGIIKGTACGEFAAIVKKQ